MQGLALGVGEVVTLVVCNEVDNGTFGKCGRLVQNEPPVFDTGSKRAHVSTVGVSSMQGNLPEGTRRIVETSAASTQVSV
jgi:hypothetical protein